MRKLRPDLVHLHFPFPLGEFANLLCGRSRHSIVTYHSDIIRQKYLFKAYKPFLSMTLKRARFILVTSPRMIETSRVVSLFSDKCRVVPYGIDLDRFKNADTGLTARLRSKYDGAPLVMFVGRLRWFKGLDYLLAAMRLVDGRLLIVGEGAEEERLKRRVSAEGLEQKVLFLGEIPNEQMPEYYGLCDVFVLPSSHRSESFGIVQIEAMACGKPVISTELGTGTSFVNLHEKTGLVVPARDSGLLAQGINRLLQDGSLRREFGRNASRRAEEFSSQSLNEKLVEIYREVQPGSEARPGISAR
jgi:glycosyltransferase involved in cell wall biosynthesis